MPKAVFTSFYQMEHFNGLPTESLRRKNIPASSKKKPRLCAAHARQVLSRNPDLAYYQGFHDVCLVFLEVATAAQARPLARSKNCFLKN